MFCDMTQKSERESEAGAGKGECFICVFLLPQMQLYCSPLYIQNRIMSVNESFKQIITKTKKKSKINP